MTGMRKVGSEDREIAARIRSVRAATGVTQRDLARALGISFTQITKYEHGSCRVSGGQLVAIARILKVPIVCLTGEDDEIPSVPNARIVNHLVRDFCALDEDLQEVMIRVMNLLASSMEDAAKDAPKPRSSATA